MQEASVRMGVNMVLYFLTSGSGSDAEFLQGASGRLRAARDESTPEVPRGPARAVDVLGAAEGWQREDWGDDAAISSEGHGVRLDFSIGQSRKVAFARQMAPPLRLTSQDSVVLDARSHLQCGCRLALGLVAGGTYYETEPYYLRPGPNTAFFRLSAATFKTESTGWAYRASVPPVLEVDRITVLVYSPMAGRVTLGDLRVVSPGSGAP
jgi:hypothetical protein